MLMSLFGFVLNYAWECECYWLLDWHAWCCWCFRDYFALEDFNCNLFYSVDFIVYNSCAFFLQHSIDLDTLSISYGNISFIWFGNVFIDLFWCYNIMAVILGYSFNDCKKFTNIFLSLSG